MNYDKLLSRGLDGTFLWETIKHRCVTHNDILDEMRTRQVQLAAYAKHSKMDAVQESMVRDILFLETMAWRVYMFGPRSTLSLHPGRDGEYLKRLRNDPAFHKMLAHCKATVGPPGCQYPESGLSPGLGPMRPRCLQPKCKHQGANKALKWLKSKIRQEWSDTILRRYKY